MPYRIFKDLIKENVEIRSALKARFEELGLSYEKIAEEGRKHGQKMSKSTISKYMKYGNIKETVSQENVLWMCENYDLEINISVKHKKVKPKRITHELE